MADAPARHRHEDHQDQDQDQVDPAAEDQPTDAVPADDVQELPADGDQVAVEEPQPAVEDDDEAKDRRQS